jgi:hypothetical protein
MLYWAEGSKGKNAIQFVNSDPAMVQYFVAFLRTCYAVRDEAFRIDCNLFADHLERQRESSSSGSTRSTSPRLAFASRPSTCIRSTARRKRKGRLPYGTVRVCVHSTELVQQIYGAIQEYGSFERPEWLG